METILTLTCALLGIAISALVAFAIHWRENRKRLSAYFVAIGPVLHIETGNEIDKRRLRIIYGDKPVNELYATTLLFKNNGYIPIKAKDFEKPINIHDLSGAEIIEATILGKQPDDVEINAITITDQETGLHTLLLTPGLINPNDEWRVQIVFNAPVTEQSIQVKGRIENITLRKITIAEQRKWSDRRQKFISEDLVGIGAALGAVSAALLLFITLANEGKKNELTPTPNSPTIEQSTATSTPAF